MPTLTHADMYDKDGKCILPKGTLVSSLLSENQAKVKARIARKV